MQVFLAVCHIPQLTVQLRLIVLHMAKLCFNRRLHLPVNLIQLLTGSIDQILYLLQRPVCVHYGSRIDIFRLMPGLGDDLISLAPLPAVCLVPFSPGQFTLIYHVGDRAV